MNKEIRCNSCGKILVACGELPTVDFLEVRKQWGYFSKKDGTIHECYVCESCYDKWLETFLIQPEIRNATELL